MSISKRLRFEIFKRDNFTCQYCGAKPPDTVLEVDHIHPRSLGGQDTQDNLKTACWACNRGKGCVPMLAPRLYTLKEGPLDGTTYDVQLATDNPVLWVMKRHDGEIGVYEDQWNSNDDESSDLYGTTRLRFGHPSYDPASRPRSGAAMDWNFLPPREHPLPEMVGVYWDRNVPRPEQRNPFILRFADMERLILELTA